MELLIPFIAFVALVLCAIPFGADSRPEIDDPGHDWRRS